MVLCGFSPRRPPKQADAVGSSCLKARLSGDGRFQVDSDLQVLSEAPRPICPVKTGLLARLCRAQDRLPDVGPRLGCAPQRQTAFRLKHLCARPPARDVPRPQTGPRRPPQARPSDAMTPTFPLVRDGEKRECSKGPAPWKMGVTASLSPGTGCARVAVRVRRRRSFGRGRARRPMAAVGVLAPTGRTGQTN